MFVLSLRLLLGGPGEPGLCFLWSVADGENLFFLYARVLFLKNTRAPRVCVVDKIYMFYLGNQVGKTGFGLAELEGDLL